MLVYGNILCNRLPVVNIMVRVELRGKGDISGMECHDDALLNLGDIRLVSTLYPGPCCISIMGEPGPVEAERVSTTDTRWPGR